MATTWGQYLLSIQHIWTTGHQYMLTPRHGVRQFVQYTLGEQYTREPTVPTYLGAAIYIYYIERDLIRIVESARELVRWTVSYPRAPLRDIPRDAVNVQYTPSWACVPNVFRLHNNDAMSVPNTHRKSSTFSMLLCWLHIVETTYHASLWLCIRLHSNTHTTSMHDIHSMFCSRSNYCSKYIVTHYVTIMTRQRCIVASIFLRTSSWNTIFWRDNIRAVSSIKFCYHIGTYCTVQGGSDKASVARRVPKCVYWPSFSAIVLFSLNVPHTGKGMGSTAPAARWVSDGIYTGFASSVTTFSGQSMYRTHSTSP